MCESVTECVRSVGVCDSNLQATLMDLVNAPAKDALTGV